MRDTIENRCSRCGESFTCSIEKKPQRCEKCERKYQQALEAVRTSKKRYLIRI